MGIMIFLMHAFDLDGYSVQMQMDILYWALLACS